MTEDEREDLIYHLLDEFRQSIKTAYNDEKKFSFIAGARSALVTVENKSAGSYCDLVERLRTLQDHYSTSGQLGPENSRIFADSALEIEHLRKALEQAKAGLETALEDLPEFTIKWTMARGALAFVRDALGTSTVTSQECTKDQA